MRWSTAHEFPISLCYVSLAASIAEIMCIWKLRFVLLIYVHARLFEPIAEIVHVLLYEVDPFLKP